MHVGPESLRWDLSLPETIRDKASQSLAAKMAKIEKDIFELNRDIEAAGGVKNVLHKLGVSDETRKLKELKKLDSELLETFSAIKKGPGTEKTLDEIIASKQGELATASTGTQKEKLQAQLKGLQLIKSLIPTSAKKTSETRNLEEPTPTKKGRETRILEETIRNIFRETTEYTHPARESIDIDGLKEALEKLSDLESAELKTEVGSEIKTLEAERRKSTDPIERNSLEKNIEELAVVQKLLEKRKS